MTALHAVSDAVVVESIRTVGIVLVSIVGASSALLVAIADRTRRHAKAASNNSAETREQVSNDHDSNLRDDLDAKFAGLDRKLNAVMRVQGTHGRQISRLFQNDRQLDEKLEHTQNTHPQPRPRQRSYKPKGSK